MISTFHNHIYPSVNTRKGQFIWLSIVLASLSVALLFLTTAARDFTNRAVVTTIETTTASLQVDPFNHKNHTNVMTVVEFHSVISEIQ